MSGFFGLVFESEYSLQNGLLAVCIGSAHIGAACKAQPIEAQLRPLVWFYWGGFAGPVCLIRRGPMRGHDRRGAVSIWDQCAVFGVWFGGSGLVFGSLIWGIVGMGGMYP